MLFYSKGAGWKQETSITYVDMPENTFCAASKNVIQYVKNPRKFQDFRKTVTFFGDSSIFRRLQTVLVQESRKVSRKSFLGNPRNVIEVDNPHHSATDLFQSKISPIGENFSTCPNSNIDWFWCTIGCRYEETIFSRLQIFARTDAEDLTHRLEKLTLISKPSGFAPGIKIAMMI